MIYELLHIMPLEEVFILHNIDINILNSMTIK